MGLIAWEKEKVKNLDLWDIGLIKWSTIAFTLLVVTFWPALASLDWYWYLVAFVILVARPMKRFFK